MSQAPKYTLSELLDIPQLQGLLDTLDEIHSLPSAIIDTEGNILTATAWQDICTKFHRANPETELKCRESDAYLASRLDELLPQAVYRCPMGLVDTATPIIVEGEHLGNVFTGQLFTSPPDEERFVRQAQEHGFDEGDYLDALRRVPIIPEERLYKNLAFLGHFAEMLATQGLVHKRQMETEAALRENEIRLRENEEKYRSLVETAQELVWKCDSEGHLAYLNPAWETTHGYRIEEMLGKSFGDFQRPEVFARDIEEFGRHMDGGSVREYETTHIAKDGHEITLLFNAVPLRDKDGQIAGTQGTATDVTDRRKAEAQIARLAAIVESSDDAIISRDVEGRITSWNGGAARLFGYQAADVLGTRADFLWPQERRGEFDEMLLRIRAGERIQRFETSRLTAKGDRVDVSLSAFQVLDKCGNEVGNAAIIRDITDWKRTEAALAESERKLRLHVRATPVAVIEWDASFRVTSWNPAAERMFGYSAAEAIGQHAHFIIPGGTRPLVDAAFAELLDRSGGERSTNENVTKDGQVIVCEWFNTPITSVDGTIIGVASITEDVTVQFNAERALQQASRLLDETQALAHLGGWEADIATGRITWTDEVYRIYGVGRDFDPSDVGSAVGFYAPEHAPVIEQAFRRARELGEPYDLELEFIRADGKHIWVRTIGKPVTENGQVVRVTGNIADITERKRTGEALARSEERIRLVFENMIEGFSLHEVITDATGKVVDFRFLDANNAHERLTGLRHDDVVGRTMLEIAPGADPRQIEAYGRVALTGEPYSFEYESKTFGKYLRVHAFSPQRGMFATVFDDLSEQKQAEAEKERLEAQLRQSQKLEAVGQLAAGIAHDFNNKLAVILGSADMAMGELDRPDDVRADIEEIRTAAWRSADLTRQLLAFARMQPIAPKQIDLNETLDSMLTMLRRLTGEEVGLEWNPDPLQCRVRMDPGQIDQVLVNLVVNARDAISGSGTVTIATRNISVGSDFSASHVGACPGRYVVLVVADDGHGMDEATKARIFEPFFTTKPQGQGTGLGLATVHGIAYQNHGFVEAESEVGKGTVVRIYLPQDPDDIVASDRVVPAIQLKASETVLLVEDEPALLKLTSRMLERLGFTVLASESPVDAVKLAAGHAGDIDLLVTDVVMPGMNGSELQRRLRTERPTLRCLYVSGYPAKVLAETGVLDDGVDLLPKPYSEESLAVKIGEVLARQ